jgi:capsular exopolysaccharide synthesis family protein
LDNSNINNLKKDIIQEFFENFDLKLFLYVFKRSFIFISILLILSLLIPFIYLRYSTPIFETTSTLIKKKEVNNSLLNGKETEFLKSNDEDKINRDIQVIKSDLLINKLLDSLDLKIQYFKKGRMFYKRSELASGSSLKIGDDYSILNKSLYNQEINLDFKDKNSFNISYKLNGKSNNIKGLKTNKTYKNDDIKFSINVIDNNIEGEYIVVFNSDESIRNYIISQINVSNASPNIYFSIKSANSGKSEYILNKLISGFLTLDQFENAERIENSILYIKSYLDTINNQVKVSQDEKMNYVRSNNAYDPGAQLSSTISEMENYKKEAELIEFKISALERVKKEVSSNASHSQESLSLKEDKDLMILIAERNKLLIDYKPNHPTIAILDRQIKDRILTIQRGLSQEINDAQQRLNVYRTRKGQAMSSITRLPEKGMELTKIQKELDIKEKFVFDLIEKQIQYLILKSSIGPDYLLIQPPKTKEEQIYPRRGLAYFIGLLAFIIISFSIVIFRYLRFDKVVSIDEIKRKTHVPILGYVPFVPEAIDPDTLKKNAPESRLVVLSNFKSRVSEVFKKMRASMKYTSAGEYKTICSTSTTPGEGKTFILINLAAVHALLDKKVLIVDLDLRKPRISKSFKISNSIGMSNLLTDKNVSIDDCIQKGIDIDNLDVITSGPIPPNPSELITSSRFDEILTQLKERYDYIFIDTPPIGLVNESIEIVNKVDISLYLVKMNHSHKDFLQMLNETDKLKKNSNLFLIVNHFGDGPSSYVNTSYGYGYGYGYGSYRDKDFMDDGYYTDKIELEKPKLIQRILKYLDWKL